MEQDYICKFCGKVCKNQNSLRNHERLCPSNPERNYVSHTLSKTAWNKDLTKETDPRVKKNSESVSIAMKNSELVKEHLSNMWTDELRQKQSERKKKLYSEHPEKHPNVKLADNRGKMTYPDGGYYEGEPQELERSSSCIRAFGVDYYPHQRV